METPIADNTGQQRIAAWLLVALRCAELWECNMSSAAAVGACCSIYSQHKRRYVPSDEFSPYYNWRQKQWDSSNTRAQAAATGTHPSGLRLLAMGDGGEPGRGPSQVAVRAALRLDHEKRGHRDGPGPAPAGAVSNLDDEDPGHWQRGANGSAQQDLQASRVGRRASGPQMRERASNEGRP